MTPLALRTTYVNETCETCSLRLAWGILAACAERVVLRVPARRSTSAATRAGVCWHTVCWERVLARRSTRAATRAGVCWHTVCWKRVLARRSTCVSIGRRVCWHTVCWACVGTRLGHERAAGGRQRVRISGPARRACSVRRARGVPSVGVPPYVQACVGTLCVGSVCWHAARCVSAWGGACAGTRCVGRVLARVWAMSAPRAGVNACGSAGQRDGRAACVERSGAFRGCAGTRAGVCWHTVCWERVLARRSMCVSMGRRVCWHTVCWHTVCQHTSRCVLAHGVLKFSAQYVC